MGPSFAGDTGKGPEVSDSKPMGMRIGESVFCAGYLAFALIAGMVLAAHESGEAGGFCNTCAAMALLLCFGDAFHLIPRILINLRGDAHSALQKQRRAFWLGLGSLISSITMTVFYVLLPDAMRQMPGAPTVAASSLQVLHVVLIVLAVVRIILCFLPQNRWFDARGDARWGMYRNVPFLAMGAITIWYLVAWYGAWLMAVLVFVSFVCYLLVVLLAREYPAVGMLMIPKTICYIWMIALFLAAL